MSAASIVLAVVLVAMFGSLVALIALDPAGHRDALRRELTADREVSS